MRALLPAVLLLSIACAAARQVSLQPAATPSNAAYAEPLPNGLPVINATVPMVVPADAAVSTTIITTVTDDGKPTETNVQTVPGVSLPPQYMPQVVQLPLINASNSTNVTAPISGVFASDVDLAKSARNSAAIAFKAAQNALQSSILSRQTAEAAAAAARSAALAAQAAISQATNGYVPSAPEGSPAFSPLVANPVPGPYPFGPAADQTAGPSASSAPAEPVNGTSTGSKGAISPFFSVSGNPTQWGINAADLPQSLALHGGDDKVSATVISCKYSVETKSVHFGQFQCQRKMDAKSGFCDNVPEDAANLLPRLHVIKQRCKSRAGVIMYPQCKHVFVRNPFHRNKLLHRVQCWSACSCHITIPRWGQCRRQAKFCLGGFTIDEFPHKQTPLYQHCIQRYNGCVSSCNVPFRACLQQNAMSPKDKLKKCLTVHKQCTLKWAGSPSQPNPPVDPQNTDNFKERFLPNVLPTREDVTSSVPSAWVSRFEPMGADK